LLFRGSKLNYQLTKQGDRYSEAVDVDINFRGSRLFTANGVFRYTVDDNIARTPLDTLNPILIDDITDMFNKAEREVNYVTRADLSWWNWRSGRGEETDHMVWTNVRFEFVEGRGWDNMNCFNEYGALYVPLRRMADWLGEEVVWDSEERKAYVVRGGDRIEMDGKVIHGATYVMVREFEKLGYTVEYNLEEWGSHIVTISRN